MGVISQNGIDYPVPSVQVQSDAQATDLINDAVQTGQTLKSYLNSKLVKWTSNGTATTGNSGNIALGINRNYLVLAVTVNGYYAYPFRNANGDWYAKVCQYENLEHLNNTQISYRVAYINTPIS